MLFFCFCDVLMIQSNDYLYFSFLGCIKQMNKKSRKLLKVLQRNKGLYDGRSSRSKLSSRWLRKYGITFDRHTIKFGNAGYTLLRNLTYRITDDLVYPNIYSQFSSKRRDYSFYQDSVCDDSLIKTSQNMRYLVGLFGGSV